MKSYRVLVLSAITFAVACGATSNPEVAATAGEQTLSTTRLAEIVGNSPAPLEKDPARIIAELWVNYQLLAEAAAKGDSVTDNKLLDESMWSMIDNGRVRKFYESISKGWDTLSSAPDEQRYMNGEALAARHILIRVDSNASPEQREAARKRADAVRAEATPANFAKLASTKTEEPGGAERGGDLGIFFRGNMVPEFEKGVLSVKPGEISAPVQSSYGFHIIYRSPYADIADKFAPIAKQRNQLIADSAYLAKVETSANVKIDANAPLTAKTVARDPLGHSKDSKTLATYKGGELTASEFADWVMAYDPRQNVRGTLINAPDSLVNGFIKIIVRNELVARQADSAKFALSAGELDTLRGQFHASLNQSWAAMNIQPSQLADSAKTPADRQKLAAARVGAYFDKLVKNEVPFVDVAYPIARAMQHKYSYSINDKALDAVVERAKAVRATADSLKAQKPGSMVPPGAPGAAPAPPAGARPPGSN